MLCHECGEFEPKVVIRLEIDGQARELQLCEACAARQGVLEFPANLSLLFGVLGDQPAGAATSKGREKSRPETVCPACGLTSREFFETERLGCEKCYEAHAWILEPLLRKIQGISLRPSEERRDYGPLLEVVDRLRGELAEAVRLERYDRAAALRDKIRTLERKLNAIGDASR